MYQAQVLVWTKLHKQHELWNFRSKEEVNNISPIVTFCSPLLMISDLFGVSESRVSQIVCAWINYIYQVFIPQLKWSSLQKNQKTYAKVFQTNISPHQSYHRLLWNFHSEAKNTYCSEPDLQRTFKSLVGITTPGAFSFVSELWDCNVSDRYITANSGFLDLISAGDEVMADRGFVIRDYLL